MFYSKQTGGFYDESIHGSRKISVVDPSWVRPTITMPDNSIEHPMVEARDTNWTGEGDPPLIMIPDPFWTRPTITVPDESASPDYLTEDNPDCKIPKDALPISEDEYKLLLLAQSNGQIIQSDADGRPVAVNRPAEPFGPLQREQFLNSRVRPQRDLILNRLTGIYMFETDPTVMGAIKTARQQLLDLTKQPAVVAATTMEDLDNACQYAYHNIIAAVPASLRNAFVAIDA